MAIETLPDTIVPAASVARPPQRIPPWERVALCGILALAAALDLVGIDRNGLGNTYYATAVASMASGWHNWFFASFDPAGFVSIDKPPLGFWVQVASVKLLGFHGISLILPQAIAGIISVALLYALVRRIFGGPAGLIAALALAISPINVVVNRDNLVESQLVALLLGAALAVSVALEHGSLRWLLLGAALVGLGFNVKMLEAYLVVPALGAAYLLAAPLPWRERARHLAAAGGLMVVVSFAWVVAVSLTPAADRPYVGSSYHNFEWDLAFAYNGLQRLFGTPWSQPPNPEGPTGAPGLWRLFIPNLGGQAAWFLPLALLTLLAAGIVAARRWRQAQRSAAHGSHRDWHLSLAQGSLVLWGLWLLTVASCISAAAFINVYYLALLTPAIAALTGIGLVWLWTRVSAGQWEGWFLPMGVIATLAETIALLSANRAWDSWLLPTVAVLAGLALSALVTLLTVRWIADRSEMLVRGVALVSLAGAIGLVPLLWTLGSLRSANVNNFPIAGPLVMPINAALPPADPHLIAWLRQHEAGAYFLAGTVGTDIAIPLILATGKPVMAMNGFTGFDPILTPSDLARRVASNQVRIFIFPSGNLSPSQMRQLYPKVTGVATRYVNRLTQWVAEHCVAVPPAQWSATDGQTATSLNVTQLFDCSALVKAP